MVLTRMGAFSPPVAALSSGQQSKTQPPKPEVLKKNAFNNIVPKPGKFKNQKETPGLGVQRVKPHEGDAFTLKPLEKADTKKAALKKPELKRTEQLKQAQLQVTGGPSCDPIASIDQEPHPDCGLTADDALLLAKNALEKKDLPERKVLMAKIKTPWDILTSDRAISKVLDEVNEGATPQEIKENNMRALFLRDNVGQCVINQAMRTWHGKRVMAAYVLKVLPSEMMPKMPAVRDISGDGKLTREDARILADSFISNKPLKNQHEKLEQVIGFKDLVVLEEEAIASLAEATENAKTPQTKAQPAMNFLFLLHDVGTQTANRIMTERADRVAYMKHMVKSLING